MTIALRRCTPGGVNTRAGMEDVPNKVSSNSWSHVVHYSFACRDSATGLDAHDACVSF